MLTQPLTDIQDSAMPTALTKQNPIVLEFKDGKRPVVVSSDDQDRFVTTCEFAAQACRQMQRLEEWRGQFYGLLEAVHEWSESNASRIDASYVSPIEGGLAIFIVPKTESYDFDLSDALTTLDISLAEKYPLCQADVLQIPGKPPERLQTFLDPRSAILIHGQSSGSHREVEA